jgi:hypothetical protein
MHCEAYSDIIGGNMQSITLSRILTGYKSKCLFLLRPCLFLLSGSLKVSGNASVQAVIAVKGLKMPGMEGIVK